MGTKTFETQRHGEHRGSRSPFLCVLCDSVLTSDARELEERIAGNLAKLLEAAT